VSQAITKLAEQRLLPVPAARVGLLRGLGRRWSA
jgi:hypothetical protein